VRITPVLLSLSWLLLLNVAILVFNLVPAFPLDGGRIARALVWWRTGSKQRGTQVAAQLGQGFAIVLAGGGILLMLSGAGLNGIWLIALAFLLGSSARGALAQSTVSERIDTVRVSDVMDSQPVAIPAATPIAQALEEYFLRYGWSWFPVIDESGRLLGIARREALQRMFDAGEGWLTAASTVGSEEPSGLRVRAEGPLTEAIGAESLGALGAVMAVDADGVLRGVLTVEQLRRALRARLAG
jgi:CBS domain-containing protein